jgi:hypothetical protein
MNKKQPTNPKQTLSYVANLYPMKHITTFLLLGIPLFVSAQSLQLSGHVYWPNGGIMEYPMTLHVAYDGCPEENVEFPFIHGVFDFAVDPVACADSIRVRITGEAKAKDGISTLDLVKLIRHLLRTQEFTNQLQLIAADANNSESVSALDLVEIRKLLLGQFTEWPKNKTLRFFVRSTQAPPLIGAPFPKLEFVIPPGGGTFVTDFWGVKTGELSNF